MQKAEPSLKKESPNLEICLLFITLISKNLAGLSVQTVMNRKINCHRSFQRGGTIRIIGARRLHCPAKDATAPVNQAVCFRALTVTLTAIGLRPSKESSPEVRLCFLKLFSELLRLF